MRILLNIYFLFQIVFVLFISCSFEQEELEFINPVKYILTVTAGEGGSVYPDTGTYDEGTVIVITATPEEGYKFDRWKGTFKDNRENQCGKGGVPLEFTRYCHITMAMDSNKNIQAFFSELE